MESSCKFMLKVDDAFQKISKIAKFQEGIQNIKKNLQ